MSSSFSFLILVLFVIVAVGISIMIKRRANSYGKGVFWGLCIYVITLLMAMLVFFFLPIENDTAEDESGEAVDSPILYQAVQNGNMDEIDEDYVRGAWNYTFEEDTLDIEAPGNDVNPINIFVEQIDDLTHEVEVVSYQTPTFMNGVNVTNDIPTPEAALVADVLTVRKPEPQDVHFSVFKSEFPIRQFSGDSLFGQRTNHISNELIYIRVPERVDVTIDRNMGIEMVGE
ncbi:hypothetical protein KFZ56_03315 [Virgibacillus sp. NKC19-3]|uniref:hypothetical protein n=1 Tax=Virgibacillus saliphilus TaxID=2831674 RepID=UPI001C9A590E|nr:hypothetical protein [Virgibacillus sp. NKC19-3]MBY7142134.1 hypothetical protein [Virgibacillus sp. NKC19-3]